METATIQLGPFQKQFIVDDVVDFNTGQNKGRATVLGCSCRGVIDFYIILLDKPLAGLRDKAIVLPSSLLSLVYRVDKNAKT